jgi:hypothetical protein
MKKILILAGFVLLFVLLLSAWLFIIDFGQFAESIGKGAGDIALEEKTKFIGTWETTYIEDDERFIGFNGIYQFNTDGTGVFGSLISTWEIVENKLIIKYYEGFASKTYEYLFSDDNTLLTLIDSNGALDFTKNIK